ncbi:hypothetical protein B0H11DRAFT_1937228 [Mycena galericulata]|nr:hypothetical protein B0H11DRAFT_1937228 [Mycena galericulata]
MKRAARVGTGTIPAAEAEGMVAYASKQAQLYRNLAAAAEMTRTEAHLKRGQKRRVFHPAPDPIMPEEEGGVRDSEDEIEDDGLAVMPSAIRNAEEAAAGPGAGPQWPAVARNGPKWSARIKRIEPVRVNNTSPTKSNALPTHRVERRAVAVKQRGQRHRQRSRREGPGMDSEEEGEPARRGPRSAKGIRQEMDLGRSMGILLAALEDVDKAHLLTSAGYVIGSAEGEVGTVRGGWSAPHKESISMQSRRWKQEHDIDNGELVAENGSAVSRRADGRRRGGQECVVEPEEMVR